MGARPGIRIRTSRDISSGRGVVQLLDRDIPTGGAVRRLGEPDRPGGIGAPSDLADQIRLRHDVDGATDVVHHWDGGDVGDRLERGVSSTADNGPGHEISYRSVLPLTWELRAGLRADDEGRSAGPPGPSAVWWARRPRARLE
ncbi:hypothetical protein ACFW6Q_10065 [Streptomyces sp. NPDC058737]|uniref:hypothetical protein n=1 Tax=Streptomyces sp. NPDC058737 TaxID=3346617 RepID=UPI0036B3E2B0